MKKCCLLWALGTAMLCAMGSVMASNTPKQPQLKPAPYATPIYHGQIFDENNRPLTAVKNVALHYYKPGSTKPLLIEKFAKVQIRNGQFDLPLGRGHSEDGPATGVYRSTKEIFRDFPELQVQVVAGDTRYAPLFRVLPAGHSLASTLIMRGLRQPDDGKPHWKHYRHKGMATAVQAAKLYPVAAAGTKTTSGVLEVAQSPFQLPVIGPKLSQPVRSLPLALPVSGPVSDSVVNPPRHEDLYDKNGKRFGTTAPRKDDPLAALSRSRAASGALPATPPPILNFEGINNVNGVLPPDTEGAVGKNHYVQVVNLSFAIYNKDGTLNSGPFNTNTLWTGFGGPCEADNSGDAIFMYDEFAERWVLTQFAVSSGQAVCFAVSTTDDPTGTYYLYQVDTQRFPDYFKLGVWPDPDNNAYFMGTDSGAQGQYDVYAMDRENMLAGLPARPAQYFQGYSNLMMPADVDGTTPPPLGTPGLFYTIRDGGEPYFGSPPNDSLDLWAFDVDWNTPANSTYSLVHSFAGGAGGEITDFIWTICGFFVTDCLPEPGGSSKLSTTSWWPLQRFTYRNFGDHQTLLGTWTVDTLASGDHAAPRWFELRNTGSGWSVFQEGTHAPDDVNRWLGSIAMDGSGNIGLVYSALLDHPTDPAQDVYPSIRYAVHEKGDAPGTLHTEAELIAGAGVQTSSSNRWGDYASMEVDPVDQCTFWMTSEYIATTGNAPWQTRIGTFKVPSCVSVVATPNSQQACSLNTASVSYPLVLSEGFTGTTNMTDSGCPAGATCSFAPNPVNAPANATSFTVAGLGSVAAGQYTIMATGTDAADPTVTASAPVFLDLATANPGDPVNTSPGSGSMIPTLAADLIWSASAQAKNYTAEISTDPSFTTVDFTLPGIPDTQVQTAMLNPNTCYYWRVKATNQCGDSNVSAATSFFTGVQTITPETSTDVPHPIGPDGGSVTTSTITVAGVGILSDVNVDNLVGTHTYMGDLTFELTSPAGTTITIMSPSCDSTDNFDINLDDEAPPGAWPCGPAGGGGTYQPSQALSAFDGENADGVWTLKITDGANIDGGQLDGWGLTFETITAPAVNPCGAGSDLIFKHGFE